MKNVEIKSSIDLRWLSAKLVKRGKDYVWMFEPREDDVIVKLPPLKKKILPFGPEPHAAHLQPQAHPHTINPPAGHFGRHQEGIGRGLQERRPGVAAEGRS
jgi:hypothetical protein